MRVLAGVLAYQYLWAAVAILSEPYFTGVNQKAQWLITVGLEGSGHHGFCDSGYLTTVLQKLSDTENVGPPGES